MFALMITVNAQTTVKTPQVVNYTYSDTLAKDETFNNTYYVKAFADNLRLQVSADTLTTGYIKVQTIIAGSLDNSNWTNIDTLVVAGSGASAYGVKLSQNTFYNYLKVTVKAIDSTQYVEPKYYLLIDQKE